MAASGRAQSRSQSDDASQASTASAYPADVVVAFRRRARLIVAVAVAATIVAIVLSLARPRLYVATAAVAVGPGIDLDTLDINMATEKQIAASTAVASDVAERLGVSTDPHDLLAALDVDVPVETDVLRVSYAARTRAAAERIAQAFADAYLEFRRQSVLAGINAAAELIDRRIARLTERLGRVAQEADSERDPGRRAGLEAEYDSLIAEITTLEQRIATAASSGIVPGSVIAPASAPPSPAAPRLLLDGLLGAVLGFFSGLAISIGLEGIDRRVRGRDDVQRLAGASILAEVEAETPPRSSNGHGRFPPTDAAAASFRRLRTRVLVAVDRRRHADGGSPLRTIAVVTSRGGWDAAYVTANLAAEIAASGRRVVAVAPSADAPLGSMLQLHEVQDSEAATGDEPAVALDRLDRMTIAADQDTLASLDVDRATRIVGQATRSGKIALVAAPGLEDADDGGALLAACDAALYVSRTDAMRDDIARAKEIIHDLGTPLLGVVVLTRARHVRAVRSGPGGNAPTERAPASTAHPT